MNALLLLRTQGTVLCVALSVTDSAGRSVTYTYEGDLLTSVTNPDGDSLTYSYDENGYLASARKRTTQRTVPCVSL